MRYKHRGSSKIKYEHSMIDGLRPLLESIEDWDEISSINPGEIRRTKNVGGSNGCVLKVQYETASGLKCIAKGSRSIQEVFIVSSCPDKLKDKIMVL